MENKFEIDKLEEDLIEALYAVRAYRNVPSRQNLISLLDELSSVSNTNGSVQSPDVKVRDGNVDKKLKKLRQYLYD